MVPSPHPPSYGNPFWGAWGGRFQNLAATRKFVGAMGWPMEWHDGLAVRPCVTPTLHGHAGVPASCGDVLGRAPVDEPPCMRQRPLRGRSG